MTFETIHTKGEWTEIKNCPGRYLLSDKSSTELKPLELIESIIGRKISPTLEVMTLKAKGLKNDVIQLVLFKNGGGLLTYVKAEKGSYVHTLNSPSGMKRKLDDFGVVLIPDGEGDFLVKENQ